MRSAPPRPKLALIHSLLILVALCSGTAHAELLSDAKPSFASERLLRIAETEAKIYQKLAENPDFYSDEDLDRRIRELIQSYHTYLSDHPKDPEAFVLYGKLLRRVGRDEEAFNAFLKADALDPRIAVVKQQLGTYLAETGKAESALTFYLLAVELDPKTAIYHYGLGELLLNFGGTYIQNGIYTRDAIDREMMKCFQTAAGLEPDNFSYQMRVGEAYYDIASPDWKAAILHWNQLREQADSAVMEQVIDLHRAKVLGMLGRYDDARILIESVSSPALQMSRQQVLDYINQF
ncbi:tetratricopeptide repeat protein [Coraliomargarita akajimensis]|uniref:TPR repeat-containing protein n=1 Tax=Coraliomargarita akajimensis (strain DSM 45221 / IAM 15411 / JCM 23193 / KCTC 12865 / 04OKA010-24) TaxID=583355 RepID=D5EJY4_CORAD|nr:tetratricopeptide repeat protein [Coraliomargarita akajimensis]ADE54733.1 TPR repeat-containing protein [Coraliomargarita akajimensis DSM 45221]